MDNKTGQPRSATDRQQHINRCAEKFILLVREIMLLPTETERLDAMDNLIMEGFELDNEAVLLQS